jgi:hypothetical protein
MSGGFRAILAGLVAAETHLLLGCSPPCGRVDPRQTACPDGRHRLPQCRVPLSPISAHGGGWRREALTSGDRDCGGRFSFAWLPPSLCPLITGQGQQGAHNANEPDEPDRGDGAGRLGGAGGGSTLGSGGLPDPAGAASSAHAPGGSCGAFGARYHRPALRVAFRGALAAPCPRFPQSMRPCSLHSCGVCAALVRGIAMLEGDQGRWLSYQLKPAPAGG